MPIVNLNFEDITRDKLQNFELSKVNQKDQIRMIDASSEHESEVSKNSQSRNITFADDFPNQIQVYKMKNLYQGELSINFRK